MKKHLLTTWLLSIMMVFGVGSAWAQTVTTYDFEDGNALFTADSRIAVSVVEGTQALYSTDFAIDGKAVFFKAANNAQNGYSFAHLDFSSLCSQAAKVKVEFDAVLGNGARSRISIGDASVRGATGNSSKTTYSNKGAIFMLGTEKSVGYINGTNNAGLLTAITQKWLKVTVEVDEAAKKYTYTIADKSTGDVLYSNGDEPISFWSTDATNCTQIDVFGYINNSTMGLIDNLIITVTKDDRPQANYTVNFLDKNSVAIKDAATRSGAVGDAITLLPSDKDPLWNAGNTQKYYYESDDSEGKTILEGDAAVVNITYRDANVYAWALNATDGTNVLKQLATGEGIEGETSYASYPRTFLQEDKWYSCTPTTGTGAGAYGYQASFTAEGTKSITYALVDTLAAFYECEDLTLVGTFSDLNGYAPARYSNGRAPRLASGSYVYTPAFAEAGTYNIYLWCRNNANSDQNIPLYYRDANGTLTKVEKAFANWGKAACTWNVLEEVPVLAGNSIVIKNDGASGNMEIDYIFFVKEGEVSAEVQAALEAAAALQAAKDALQADINAAKAIDTTGKELAESLAGAITTAETLLNAVDATVESLSAAQEELAKVVEAYEMANAKTIFLAPGPWNVDGARYAAYVWKEKGNTWFDFAAAEEDGVYTVAIPESYTGLILARMNGAIAENNWEKDTLWNKTADIDFTAVADSTLFTITGWNVTDFETSKYAPEVAPVLNTYTATFTTNAGWEKVYAYVWTGEGQDKVLGEWPGTELTATEGIYTVTIKADAAPEFIIFNNGKDVEKPDQTIDLPFENGKAYSYATFAEPVDYTAKVNADGWKSDIGAVGNYTKDVAQKEQYLTNTTTLGEVLYQTVEGLENGNYTVELYANASYTAGRGFASDAQDGDRGRVIVYAGNVEKTIPVVYQTAVGENNIVTLENAIVTDGTLKMGLRKDIVGSNWHTIQIKSITQTGTTMKADAAVQDEYWKGIATQILANEAYANVAGVEKATLQAADNKAAVKEAIAPFYAAKTAYDALVKAIGDANDAGVDAADAKAVLAAAETTAADAAEALHLVKLAVNTKAVAGATAENPVETNFVVNGTFDTAGVIAPWKTTGGFQNQTTATNQNGAFTVPFFENWNGSAKVNKMYQIIEDIPNGVYTLKIAAFVNNLADPNESQFVFANNDKTFLTTGEPTAYTVTTVVTNNKIEIGLEQTTATANWMGIDNVSLLYAPVDLTELINAYNTAKAAAQAVEGKMNKDVKDALERALAANVNMEDGDSIGAATAALTDATAAAKASVAAFANATNVLPKMKELTESTNVYTAEALAEYYTQWLEKYEAETLTTDEGNALQDPNVVTGWHNSITVDNFLLSAWDTEADKFEGYYINSWSTEGNNDGSEFKVPFFEYWTGDANSLGEKTMTATMNNLPEGKYDVTAWVRVRIKNGAEAPAYGITFQANEGEAVNVADGTQIGTSQFYLKDVAAKATVGEDGVLKIQFVVAADNNISWLSFKNVKFTKYEEPVYTIVGNETAIFGEAWNPTAETNDMVKGEDGIYTKTYEGIELAAGTVYYKVVKNHSWDTNWGFPEGPDGNADYVVNEAGKYNITFSFNPNAVLENGFNVACKMQKAEEPQLPEGAIYMWESPEGETVELGGKVTGVNNEDRINYQQAGYYTICLRGSADYSSQYVTITLDDGFTMNAGDEIEITAFRNKNETGKRSGAKLQFDGGASVTTGDGTEFVNLHNAVEGDAEYSTEPNTVTVTVPEGVVDCKTIKITRSQTSTNLFISKLLIKDLTTTGISNINADVQVEGIYNLRGQKVEKAQKGLYIINGKKVVIK